MPKGKKKSGFSLIEILISLIFIGALVTILFTTTGSLFTRRQSDLQSVAAKILTKEIERLRGEDFTNLLSLKDNATCMTESQFTSSGGDATDMNKLTGSCIIREITDYQASANKIYEVNLTLKWKNDNNADKTLQMDTLISENGL